MGRYWRGIEHRYHKQLLSWFSPSEDIRKTHNSSKHLGYPMVTLEAAGHSPPRCGGILTRYLEID